MGVTYDLTALTPAGESWVETFNARYENEIAAWSTEIAAALRRSAENIADPGAAR